MTYLQAADHADKAADLADKAGMMRNNDEPDRAFECLSFAVLELSKAVAELSRAAHRAS
ncbi:hypothetical protein [Curtobacterium aetherium]|uniref:Uncharacterized protein n=1 Tax=Curtobacterium aetherium TaxID=2841594 RepID=A0ACD1E5R8_9MICO|nr:hypothetical protein [Curtobacterium sp. L6-1]QWS34051.1 hypothetical protein KM842_02275 [Curtobacterium sp. L6-1]